MMTMIGILMVVAMLLIAGLSVYGVYLIARDILKR